MLYWTSMQSFCFLHINGNCTKWDLTQEHGKTTQSGGGVHSPANIWCHCFVYFFSLLHKMCLLVGQYLKLNLSLKDPKQTVVDLSFPIPGNDCRAVICWKISFFKKGLVRICVWRQKKVASLLSNHKPYYNNMFLITVFALPGCVPHSAWLFNNRRRVLFPTPPDSFSTSADSVGRH